MLLLSDRIGVIFEGRIVGIVDPKKVDIKETINKLAEELEKRYNGLFTKQQIIEHLWNGVGAHYLVEGREYIVIKLRIFTTIFSIIFGFFISSIILILTKENPLLVFKSIFIGAVGSKYAITESLVFATPLIIISAGLTLSYKMNFWNIGAFGQYILGAIFSSYFALFGPQDLSRFTTLSIMVLLSLIGGAIFILIPAILKSIWDVNEVISTLLLNYIALNLLKHLMYGPWKDPSYLGFPLSRPFNINAHLPRLLTGSRTNIGLIIGIIVSIVIWILEKIWL